MVNMRYYKVKFLFGACLFAITFFFISLLISIRYLDVPNYSDSLDVRDILESIPGSTEKFKFTNLQRKMRRVQALGLKKLKKATHCRFHCKPAVDFHSSGVQMSLSKSDPSVRVMMLHCMHCLKSKGIMVKIRERKRRKREILEQMIITPNTRTTQSAEKKSPSKRSRDHKHELFGGWISNVFHSKEQKMKINEKSSVFKTRKLLNIIKHKARKAEKTKVFKTPMKRIVVGKQDDDEDYENNYEDNFDSDVPDLKKQAQRTQEAITYFLIGSFAFFALLFMFVFPVASFVRMCLKNYDSNLLIVSDILRCRDPKYRLVKEMCDKCEIPIPDYRLYKKLMRIYEAKDAETIAKERREKFIDEEDYEE